jgi:hypothetical protein
VWVRAVSPASSQLLSIRLRVLGPNDTFVQGVVGSAIAPPPDWQLVEATLVTNTAGRLNVYVSADPAASGDCFLADDVSVVRTN